MICNFQFRKDSIQQLEFTGNSVEIWPEINMKMKYRPEHQNNSHIFLNFKQVPSDDAI